MTTDVLREALDNYFSIFETTKTLVSELIAREQNPMEILILLCARLDALASGTIAETESSKKAFVRFVIAYGGDRTLFESISVADVYFELGYHRWLLDGTIPKSGRLYRFSRINDPILHLIEDAGLPITLEAYEDLLSTLMDAIKKSFRVTRKQSPDKPALAKADVVVQKITRRIEHSKFKKVVDNIPRAVRPLLESKRVAVILYERFRSAVIHGAAVNIDEKKFFSSETVYWQSWHSLALADFSLIEFPAKFLFKLMDRSISTYKAHLVNKRKIPPEVHYHAFPDSLLEYVEFLDDSMLPDGGTVRLDL